MATSSRPVQIPYGHRCSRWEPTAAAPAQRRCVVMLLWLHARPEERSRELKRNTSGSTSPSTRGQPQHSSRGPVPWRSAPGIVLCRSFARIPAGQQHFFFFNPFSWCISLRGRETAAQGQVYPPVKKSQHRLNGFSGCPSVASPGDCGASGGGNHSPMARCETVSSWPLQLWWAVGDVLAAGFARLQRFRCGWFSASSMLSRASKTRCALRHARFFAAVVIAQILLVAEEKQVREGQGARALTPATFPY